MSMTDAEMIKELRSRGYVIRHQTEAFVVSWHRTLPIPAGVDFTAEAVTKIKEQLASHMLEFRDEPGGLYRSAKLRILV